MNKSERSKITEESNNSFQQSKNNKPIQRPKHKKASQKSIKSQKPKNQPLQILNDQKSQQIVQIEQNSMNPSSINQQLYSKPIIIQQNAQNVIPINQDSPKLEPLVFNSIYPKDVTCPYCYRKIETTVKESFNFCKCCSFICCIVILTCFGDTSYCKDCCCCCCRNDCKCFNDGDHYCSNCGRFLGTYPPPRNCCNF